MLDDMRSLIDIRYGAVGSLFRSVQGWERGAFRAPGTQGSGRGAGEIGDTFTAPVVKDADGRAGRVAAKAFEDSNERSAGAGDVPEVSKVS